MEELRNIVREAQRHEQVQQRESLLNRNRAITALPANLFISREDLITKAKLLKIKSGVSCDLLSSLKQALLQNENNIVTFLKVDGALQGLIRCLTGQNAKFQIHAAHCICNLSLGKEKLSRQVISLAGPYLIVHLEGMNIYLIEACAWSIGNLCSAGPNCVKLLKTQGAFPSLVHLLSHSDQHVQTAATYSLTQFIYHGFDVLEGTDYQQVIQPVVTLFKTNSSSVSFLMFLLSAQPHCQLLLLQQQIHVICLQQIINSLQQIDQHVTWYLCTIGNLVSEASGEAALQLLRHVHYKNDSEIPTLPTVVSALLNAPKKHLIKKLCWLVGNFLNHPNSQVCTVLFESKIVLLLQEVVLLLNLMMDENSDV